MGGGSCMDCFVASLLAMTKYNVASDALQPPPERFENPLHETILMRQRAVRRLGVRVHRRVGLEQQRPRVAENREIDAGEIEIETLPDLADRAPGARAERRLGVFQESQLFLDPFGSRCGARALIV